MHTTPERQPTPAASPRDRAIEQLSAYASPESIERLRLNFDDIARDLSTAWLTGATSYQSQTQQSEAWYGRLYELVYIDEQPDAMHIFRRHGIPLPRAQYIARLLRARYGNRWRAASIAEARRTLELYEADAKKAVEERRGGTQFFDLNVSRGAYDQLLSAHDEAANARVGQIIPESNLPAFKRQHTSAARVWVSISAKSIIAVLDILPLATASESSES